MSFIIIILLITNTSMNDIGTDTVSSHEKRTKLILTNCVDISYCLTKWNCKFSPSTVSLQCSIDAGSIYYYYYYFYPYANNITYESCLQKVTGNELKYTAIVGKPSEISYRYAEHCLTEQSRRLSNNPSPLKTLYMIG